MTDTIFARATPPGRGGVSVVRVSGPDAKTAAAALVGDLPMARRAALRSIRDDNGRVLDEGLVLVFPAGASFTGEDVVEFQLHGSPAIVSAVLAALGGQPGLREAEAGEFTRRALENERLDLAQVEGLADLIEAETELQRRQAYSIFSGQLGGLAEGWRRDLIRAASLIEATIDFADEDVPVDVFPEVRDLLAGVESELRREAQGVAAAERVREGFQVAIIGPPNAGKSTLLNMIAGRDVALTSEIAGTTRDIIEVHTDLNGLPVTFLDTAGLRETADHVEALGVDRARQRAREADLRVILTDPNCSGPDHMEPQDIVVVGKGDLFPAAENSVSGKTGDGIQDLLDRIEVALRARIAGIGTATRQRHKKSLEAALSALAQVRAEMEAGIERSELAAEGLRTALRALDQLVGRVDVEAILDEIFASFCIGK